MFDSKTLKKLISFLLLFGGGFFIVSGQETWNKSLDYNLEQNYGSSILELDDSLFVCAAKSYTESLPYGILLGLDKFGERIWSQEIHFGDTAFFLKKSYKIFNQQLWTVGSINHNSEIQYSPVIIASSFSGAEIWRKFYDFSPYNVNFNRGILELNDTTIIAFFDGWDIDDGDIYLHKYGYLLLDAEGKEKYRHWFPTEFDVNLPHDFKLFPGGGYVLSILEIPASQGIPFEHSLTIKRLDDNFQLLWQRTLPCEEGGSGKFTFDEYNNIYVGWTVGESMSGDCYPWGDPAIFSYDSDGNFRWKTIFDDNPRSRFLGYMITTSDNNIVSCGLDEPGFPPLQWGWAVSIDTSGKILWDRKYTIRDIPINFGGFFGDLMETSDKSLIFVGNIHDKYPIESFLARENIWLVKTDSNGCITDKECDAYSVLTEIYPVKLIQDKIHIYPNPASDILYVDLEEAIETKISIIDIQGKILLQSSSTDRLTTLDISKLPYGCYYLRISTINFIRTKMFTIIK